MPAPLVTTKLYVPKLRRGSVPRPRLTGRLDRGEARLTLISAPAGFGKTTLLAEWLAGRSSAGRAVAWLSLDPSDNEPVPFWSHLAAALEAAAPGAGAAAVAGLAAGQPPDHGLIATLVNGLEAAGAAIDLVLDDYHLIDHPGIASGMAFLLDRQPDNLHLVIATRADPALPLPRLRARGELSEIRSADLRFTDDETDAYLTGTMGLGLAPEDVAALAERTEGWAAALQLAALSMQGREEDDLGGFIENFAGTDRYVFDYLVEEVLSRQPEDVRRFLLRTAFLARLSGPLCDAVTGGTGGRAMLEALERGNLFVVPLDDRREWYRYHHLFADVLQTHLGDADRAELPLLHRRASAWFEESGDQPAAVDHALAGGDHEHAGDLAERALPEMRRTRREATIRAWLMALPDPLVRASPALGLGLVGALMSLGEFDGIEGRLRDAERRLPPSPDAPAIDPDEAGGLRGAIELYRAALAQVRGDVAATIGHARLVHDYAPADDHLARAGASGFLGIAFWTSGELAEAQRNWRDCFSGLRRAGHIADVFGSALALSDIAVARGLLGEAARICEEALRSASQSGPALRGTADMFAALSGIALARNDIAASVQHLRRAEELGELAGLPQHAHRLLIATARLRLADGDPDGALDLLAEAEQVYVPDFFPRVRPIPAIRARVQIARGQLGEALRWQRDSGIGAGDELAFLREYEHITLARLLLRQEDAASAIRLLDRLLAAAETGGRFGSVIEIALLLALAHRDAGDPAAALAPLERALTLAAPEGFVRVFLDEGEPAAALLKAAAKHGVAPDFSRALVAAFGTLEPAPAASPDLVEPLSERELDVLRLLRSDLDGPEIARELLISLNTMRTHTKKIYEKLGVTSRRAAVRRAEELNLLQGRRP